MDDETQFCLKWHNHQSTLIRNFDTLLESGTLVDCTLAAEGRYLKAHKVVLSACSPYFEGLLSEHYDKHPVFILKDVKFVELKAMMDYMYRGEVNISQNQLTALLKAAESLQIKGLSDSKTTGSSNNSTVAGRVEPKSTATSTSNAVTTAVDIPQGSSGLTIEKNNKVPRQRLTQTSANMSEGGASPQQVRGISSREGSVSPTRKRRARRRSLGNDESNSMENHEASNSSDVTASATVMAAPTVEDKSHAESADPIGRSALMQQLTKSNDDMLQMQMEKPEPTEDMIQPKSEYMEDQESVEDLTHLDDDMNDLNEMEQDNSRAGPSHDSSHPGLASWHITSDRSNAGVGAAGGAQGADDAVFMNAHETNAAQRDSQGNFGLHTIDSTNFPLNQVKVVIPLDVLLQSSRGNLKEETDQSPEKKEELRPRSQRIRRLPKILENFTLVSPPQIRRYRNSSTSFRNLPSKLTKDDKLSDKSELQKQDETKKIESNKTLLVQVDGQKPVFRFGCSNCRLESDYRGNMDRHIKGVHKGKGSIMLIHKKNSVLNE
ncbi:longitudinals lacking protein, isoforms H/M/V isoform X10 [Trichogramma pretiosum]|uniref:longitudinals lacking protein, isoforms H/M/V isoform X10 n=1 Tax=Trichogramma pretiosum TaxID=7493 RepID=UPI000C719B4D|nr:longitudinals lacking protein, isoforms H/M/V isoform X10 [Trichogramma pretiosum]